MTPKNSLYLHIHFIAVEEDHNRNRESKADGESVLGRDVTVYQDTKKYFLLEGRSR